MVNNKIFKKGLFFITLLFVATLPSFAQMPDEIYFCIKTGNSVELSKYFSEEFYLVSGKENIYGHDHALQVLKKFFTNHPPRSFTKNFDGKKGDSLYYYIYTLKTSNGNYRITLFIKKTGGRTLINQMMIIEEQNGN